MHYINEGITTAYRSLRGTDEEPEAQKGQMISTRMHSRFLEEAGGTKILNSRNLAFLRRKQCLSLGVKVTSYHPSCPLVLLDGRKQFLWKGQERCSC